MKREIIALAVATSLLLPIATAQTGSVQMLRIHPLEGQNAVNSIPMGTSFAPVIEVRDQNDRPVDGAVVIFKLPASGPGATFGNGATTEKAISDFRGQAGVKTYTSNKIPGRFVIEVTATYQNVSNRLLITQTNSNELPESARATGSRRKLWILLGAAAAAGAGAGIYFGTRSGSTPISVSAGSVVFGGPR